MNTAITAVFSAYAFGYDPHNDDYKVLLITGIEVKIYSLTLHAWKKVGKNQPNKLSWMSSLHNILAFDFAKENFRVYKTPLQQIEYDNRKTCLGVLGGCLCLL